MLPKIIAFLYFFSLYFSGSGFIYLYYVSFFLSSSFFALSAIERGRIRVDPTLRKFLLFLVFSGLSITWAVNENFASEMFIRLMLLTLNLVIVTDLLHRSEGVATYGVLGLVGGMLFQAALIPFDAAYHSGRFLGTTINPNHVAVLSVLTYAALLILFAVKKVRVYPLSAPTTMFFFLLFSSLASMAVILNSESRKGMLFVLLLLLSVIVRLAYRRMNLLRVAGFSAILIFLVVIATQVSIGIWSSIGVFERFSGSLFDIGSVDIVNFDKGAFEGDGSTKFRLFFISLAIGEFFENPLLGRGLDNFRGVYNDKLYSHSNFFELLSTLGICGALLYYNFVWSIVKVLAFSRFTAAVIIIVAIIFFEFFMVSYFERFYLAPLLLMSSLLSANRQGNRI